MNSTKLNFFSTLDHKCVISMTPPVFEFKKENDLKIEIVLRRYEENTRTCSMVIYNFNESKQDRDPHPCIVLSCIFKQPTSCVYFLGNNKSGKIKKYRYTADLLSEHWPGEKLSLPSAFILLRNLADKMKSEFDFTGFFEN